VDTDAFDKRIYWRSRRGMLELELLLVPFVTHHYPDLTDEQKTTYGALLEHEDWQIFDWLREREHPEDPSMRMLVDLIRAYDGS